MARNSSNSAPFLYPHTKHHETYQKKYRILPVFLPALSAKAYCIVAEILELVVVADVWRIENIKGEVKAKIKISPVVVFGVLSRMVLVRES